MKEIIFLVFWYVSGDALANPCNKTGTLEILLQTRDQLQQELDNTDLEYTEEFLKEKKKNPWVGCLTCGDKFVI